MNYPACRRGRVLLAPPWSLGAGWSLWAAGSQKGKDTEEGRNPQFLKPIMMLGLEGKLQLMQVCQVLWVCYYASLLFPRVT